MTANQTRLGMNFTAMDTGDKNSLARSRFDFYGGGDREQQGRALMRHAYMQSGVAQARLHHPRGPDLRPHLAPRRTHRQYTVGWDAGQHRLPPGPAPLRQRLEDERQVQVRLALGFFRTIGHVSTDFGNIGRRLRHPHVPDPLRVHLPGCRRATGEPGHLGPLRARDLPSRPARTRSPSKLSSYSYNLDASVPLSKTLTLQAGGLLRRGPRLVLRRQQPGLRSEESHRHDLQGGWAAISWQPPPLDFNFGGGTDNPQHGVPPHRGARNKPESSRTPGTPSPSRRQVGFEVTRWVTGYMDKDTVKAMRYQLSFMYTF